MGADPKAATDEPQENEYLDYIPVDVVQRILTYPARRAAKLAELASEEAATLVESESQDIEELVKQKGRWARAGCDVLNASDVNAFINTKMPPIQS